MYIEDSLRELKIKIQLITVDHVRISELREK